MTVDPFPFGPRLFGGLWEALLSRIEILDEGSCWLWTGALDTSGYGKLNGKVDGKGKTFAGHRVSLEASSGVRLGSLHALHRCPNRNCCNPSHLRPGTNADNVQDREEFGSGSSGVGNGRAILNEKQVYDMLSETIGSVDPVYAHVARRYGVSRRQVCSIRKGDRWPEVFERWTTFNEFIGDPSKFKNPYTDAEDLL